MELNNFFDKIYCINLKRRRDRFLAMKKIFRDLGIKAEVFRGIEGNEWNWKNDKYPHPMRGFDGVAGGTSTQITIIKEAIHKGYESILILEDDCEFIDRFNVVFKERNKEVPSYWDMLYLGGLYSTNGVKPLEVSKHVVKSFDMMSTHAYALHNRIFSKAIKIMTNDKPYLTNSADGYLCKLQKECQAYAFNPPLIWQKADYSDIQHGQRDYVKQFKQKII